MTTLKFLKRNLLACRQEVINSFRLFRVPKSGLQIIKYFSQRHKLQRLEAGLYGVAYIYSLYKGERTTSVNLRLPQGSKLRSVLRLIILLVEGNFIQLLNCIAYIIDQFRYIKIQPKTIELRTRLWGINPTNSVFIPQSLVLRSIVLG